MATSTTSSLRTLPPGTAPIKPEYILPAQRTEPALPDDDAAEGNTRGSPRSSPFEGGNEDDEAEEGRPEKRQKLSGAQRKKLAKEENTKNKKKKPQRGANKGRKFRRVTDELELCPKVGGGDDCKFGEKCKFTHDITRYLITKPRDLTFPFPPASSNSPFIAPPPSQGDSMDPTLPSIDSGTKCPIFEETGTCRYGLRCRFLGGHVRKVGDKVEAVNGQGKEDADEMNYVRPGVLKELRTKQYFTPMTDEYLGRFQHRLGVPQEESMEEDKGKRIVVVTEYDQSQEDDADAPLRPCEKRRLHWEGKTYLAPLTTVGNLPFRRLCTTFGADITCSEMAMASSLLHSAKDEWSLLRRHPTERTFGVQLAGNKPGTLVPAAEVLAREFGAGSGSGGIDFVDLNCGCPIDLVFGNGAGAALLDQPGKLGKILVGMNRALGEIPLTLKVRTGVRDGRNTAHKLMPRLGHEWGASCVTVHGRTRQQRYTKLADWNYIKLCVESLRATAADDDQPPIPIFGGGDCYSAAQYWEAVEQTGVDGVMVARGALIKPWIFTEIKERREWDISARERLDIIKMYAEYGLSHFGSDTAGVNTTRRYLCEALSFQYRYIPIGLLERLPGQINDRPLRYRGRDELETMLASGDSRTWVKLSEMFLGPAPETFVFTPKHKSNSYVDIEAQG